MLDVLNFGSMKSLVPMVNLFSIQFSEAEIMNLKSTFSPQVLLPVCTNIFTYVHCMYCTLVMVLFHIVGARK